MADRRNDKRAAPRIKHDSVVELFNEKGALIDSGRLVDISDTGAAFFSKKVISKGERIKVRVRLLEKGALDISALVMWAREDGAGRLYGLKFDEVKECFATGERKRPLSGL